MFDYSRIVVAVCVVKTTRHLTSHLLVAFGPLSSITDTIHTTSRTVSNMYGSYVVLYYIVCIAFLQQALPLPALPFLHFVRRLLCMRYSRVHTYIHHLGSTTSTVVVLNNDLCSKIYELTDV